MLLQKRHRIRRPVSLQDAVLYYKLHAGFTTGAIVYDYSGSGNDGTANGTSIVPAYPGFDLAGSNEYFDTGSTFQSTFRASFTLAAWAKLDDGQGGFQSIIGIRDTTGNDNRVDLSVTGTGALIARYQTNGSSGNSGTTGVVLPSGQTDWFHIAATFDSVAQQKLVYCNGVSQALSPDGSTVGVTFTEYTSDENVYVGGVDEDGSLVVPIAGLVDEPMIFSVAKTAAEIQSIYETQRWRYAQ